MYTTPIACPELDPGGGRANHIYATNNTDGSYDNQDRLLSYGVNTYPYSGYGPVLAQQLNMPD